LGRRPHVSFCTIVDPQFTVRATASRLGTVPHQSRINQLESIAVKGSLQVPDGPADAPLRTNVLYKHVQDTLTCDSAVIAETGDSWFNCQKLKLPDGCGYEFQVRILAFRFVYAFGHVCGDFGDPNADLWARAAWFGDVL